LKADLSKSIAAGFPLPVPSHSLGKPTASRANGQLHHRLNAFFCSAKAGNLSELAGGVNDLEGKL